MITAAAAVELVHLATLYHDDVMDEATMRRGAKSVNARWDNTIAILTGDFLFAHASGLVADLGSDAARIIAETMGGAGHRADAGDRRARATATTRSSTTCASSGRRPAR